LTAGPRGAYEYHALSADAQVLDAGVTSPAPGQVQVVVLGRSGVPASTVTDAVSNALNAEEVRSLCDTLIVLAAELVSYDVTAVLTFQSGQDRRQRFWTPRLRFRNTPNASGRLAPRSIAARFSRPFIAPA
jgi:phage-related baseplate assembly protein